MGTLVLVKESVLGLRIESRKQVRELKRPGIRNPCGSDEAGHGGGRTRRRVLARVMK
jgi:hypothetical protein